MSIDTITIRGIVSSRSTKPGSEGHGPPGEAEILALNPDRRQRILDATGWAELEPGTLNLECDESAVAKLLYCPPCITEAPVRYPHQYANIPGKRVGYLYYHCTVANSTKAKVTALVRRAMVPVKGRLELLAPLNIRNTLGVGDGDRLRVVIPRQASKAGGHVLWRVDGRPANIEGIMQGAPAFLCCSGPSLNLIDKRKLRYVFTMCMNNGPVALTKRLRPNLWTFVDGPDKFLYTIWEDPHILKLVPDSHPDKEIWNSDTGKPHGKKVRECPNVLYYARDEHFNPATFLTADTVNWGNHGDTKDANGVGGKRSVMHCCIKLLYVLGFRTVYLVGCDFRMKEGEQNYSFDQDRKPSAVKGNNSSYAQMDWRFKELRPSFEAAGFNIYNTTEGSGLTAFDHVPFDQAIAEALKWTPDPKRYMRGRAEKTAGLYESKWYVCPTCKESSRWAKADIKVKAAKCVCGYMFRERNRRKNLKDPADGTSQMPVKEVIPKAAE